MLNRWWLVLLMLLLMVVVLADRRMHLHRTRTRARLQRRPVRVLQRLCTRCGRTTVGLAL
jgi:hypothetical protein